MAVISLIYHADAPSRRGAITDLQAKLTSIAFVKVLLSSAYALVQPFTIIIFHFTR